MSCSAISLLSLSSLCLDGCCCGLADRGRTRIHTHDGQLTAGKVDEWNDLTYNSTHLSELNGTIADG